MRSKKICTFAFSASKELILMDAQVRIKIIEWCPFFIQKENICLSALQCVYKKKDKPLNK